jgi:hypothetical protein
MSEETKAAGAGKIARRATNKKGKTAASERGAKPSETDAPTSDCETGRDPTPEDRWNMIAEAAYYLAEKRGFSGGHPAEDWKMAEAEIDAMLAKKRP